MTERRYGHCLLPLSHLRCVYEVGRSPSYQRQCSRKRGHGPDGLYCKQHARVEAKRDMARRTALATALARAQKLLREVDDYKRGIEAIRQEELAT